MERKYDIKKDLTQKEITNLTNISKSLFYTNIIRDTALNVTVDDIFQDAACLWLSKKQKAIEYLLSNKPDSGEEEYYKFMTYYIKKHLRWAYMRDIGERGFDWKIPKTEDLLVPTDEGEEQDTIRDKGYLQRQIESSEKDVRLLQIYDIIRKKTKDSDIILMVLENHAVWATDMQAPPNRIKAQFTAYLRKILCIPPRSVSSKGRPKIENIMKQLKNIKEECMCL